MLQWDAKIAMAFEIRWYVPDRLVYVQFYDTVTEADVRRASLTLVNLLDFDPRKYMIFDASLVTKYPTLMEIKNAMMSANLRYTSTWVITYGFVQGIAQFLLAVAVQLIRVRFRALTSLEESLAFLQEVDSTLPPMLPVPPEFYTKTGIYSPLPLLPE